MRKQLLVEQEQLEAQTQQQQQQPPLQNEHSPLLLRTYNSIEDGRTSDNDDDDDDELDHGNLFFKMTKRIQKSIRQSLRSNGGAGSSIRAAAGEAREAIAEEYANVKEAWVDHLYEVADETNQDFFMDMNLVRNLSILPSQRDIKQLKEAVTTPLRRRVRPSERQQAEAEAEAEGGGYKTIESATDVDVDSAAGAQEHKPGGGVPLTAYLTLGSAVTALSSIGPFLAAQRNVEPTMKIVWRFQGTALLLAPFMIQSIIVEGFPRLSKTQWFVFLVSSASYAVLCVAFAMSINYTSVANATILTNSQSVLLVISKLLMGSHVVCWEGVGVFVAFAGAVLCSRDATQTSQQLDRQVQWWLSLWGDCLGLISSVGGIGYIVLGKRLRSIMPVLVFMVLNMTVASFLILAFMYAVGQEVSFDRHADHGVLGWMNLQADRLPLEMLTVVVCNLMGTMGYVRAFKYFSSVIIAVAALMEPVVASFTVSSVWCVFLCCLSYCMFSPSAFFNL